ncbi:MAG: CotH kinase family protein [Cellvibrio sp.]|uniref:CotH kinase family protein n=1 Tax=Cellvibrio sp. TaxID=1965322 RepID=UPI0027265C58|nr:CotH kinase family protein [Cellvibrio sp.]
MPAIIRFSIIVLTVLLQACGGGSGSKDSVASSATLASSVAAIISSSNSSSSFASSMPADFPVGTVETLPVLKITTDGAAPILSKETYVNATFSLTSEGAAAVEGTTEIRGRGNSTWSWVKKPYRLKLTNSTEMLGMPASKHWVLLANYADKTLVRNDIAFMFSRNLGMEYTVRNQHVEVTLNGAYQGVYQLVEHIRVAKDRVNIPELKVADTDAEKITGGYLMEVDFRMHKDYCINATWESFCVNGVNMEREATFCVDSTHGMNPFCLDTPETLLETSWSAQRDYINKYITDTEAALFGNNFTDPQLGYAAYIDVDSAINYFLINELFKNPDGAVASFYLYKKRNGKLFFGPIWDFDLAFGNAGYDDVDKTYGWHIRPAPWFDRLFQDPAFKTKVKERWNNAKAEGKLDYIFLYANARAAWLDKQQQKNYMLWSITDFAPWILHGSHGGIGSYEAEVKEMVRWQRERYQWLDTELNK